MPVHSTYIRYFDMVRRQGSIRKAADQLFVASSAVSRQIMKLEDELGVNLFSRSPAGVKLTEEGRIFSRFVDKTMVDLEHTQREIELLNTVDSGKISIAAQESVVADFLPAVMLQFNDKFPDIEISFTTVSGRKLLKMLNKRHVDIAIAFDPQGDKNIEQLVVQKLRVRAIMAPTHPLASKNRSKITLQECVDYPIILPDYSWPLRDPLDQLVSQISTKPNVITTSNSVTFIRRMLASKACIGFQTIVGIERKVDDGAFITIPLHAENKLVTQDFALCVRSDTKPSEAFITLIKLLTLRFKEYHRYY